MPRTRVGDTGKQNQALNEWDVLLKQLPTGKLRNSKNTNLNITQCKRELRYLYNNPKVFSRERGNINSLGLQRDFRTALYSLLQF